MKEDKKYKVMLVDDDQDDRLLFKQALQKISIPSHLISTESCKEAIETLEKTTGSLPDIIFLDLNMPDQDGFSCITEIKSNPEWCSIPVWLYSTSRNPADIQKAEELGAAGYLKKPNDFGELCNSLEKLITVLN